MLEKQRLSGVSPVIGIILMVAVTVGLVALASTIVFDLGSNVNEPADVSAELTYDESAGELKATVVRNDNAKYVQLRHAGSGTPVDIVGTRGSDMPDVGGTGTVTVTSPGSSGTAEVVAVVDGTDGQEQVIRTLQY